MGLKDDFRPFSRYIKLILQTLIALTTILIGIRMEVVFFSTWLNVLLSVIWIVGITNGFNIIDVMDGIAGGVALFAAATFIFISALGTGSYPLLAVSLAGGCLGFLPYNLPRARLFMGDAGSLFVGYMLSVIAIKTSYTTSNPIALFVPLLILFYPIFDTVYVVSLRLLKRKNPLVGSPDHFVLKLKASGLPIPSIIAIIYLATISLCEASFIITRLPLIGAVILYSVALLIFVMFGVILKGRT
ncbi:undecaprenyl/decaprenyl-phosphate alpha-N-acetylglucosaminyl 1-phosphate transferase [candidate division WOR-3 bacterium]|nr:undecaprenyl/decaprenyl-phosphate alpha-N-acetylglucosaminyl 1-phosphate transferase [candidate division WOR-3 bacterium]